MGFDSIRPRLVLLLALAALVVLVAALVGGLPWPQRSTRQVVLLLDRSASMPREAADRAREQALAEARRRGADMTQIAFAAAPGSPAPADHAEPALDADGTDIGAALDAALEAHARTPFDLAVVVSDGHARSGRIEHALRASRAAGLPVFWMDVGREPPPTHLRRVRAPRQAWTGQAVVIDVELGGAGADGLTLVARARSATGEVAGARSAAGARGRAELRLEGLAGGAWVVDLSLEDAAGRVLDARTDAALVEVTARAPLLVVQGSPGPFADSLAAGGWPVDRVSAARLDSVADRLDSYRALVLDDVAVSDAGARAWQTLADAVRQRGVGLLVLGGERSFARGGYRDSVLESVLPLRSTPAALDRPTTVLFAVDKSGSMGAGGSGVQRLRFAQQAVVDAAATLGERDAFGVMVFDVAPRVLLPVAPAGANRPAIEGPWATSPGGGTRLAPALDAAIAELERVPAGRRLLVMVTDGAVDEAPLVGLRARLDRARIETVWLAIGPDVDLRALERVIGTDAGLVRRVDQAAELPLAMRSGLERRRSPVERGRIGVRPAGALPPPIAALADWPDIDAIHPTQPRPGAVVALQTERGDPLLAHGQFGFGRVVALASGLGAWTPDWTRWAGWPALAGGLADWIAAVPPNGSAALRIVDGKPGLVARAEVGPKAGAVTIAAQSPGGMVRPAAADEVAPGRWEVAVPDAGPGVYAAVLVTALGTQRVAHLVPRRVESEDWGIAPQIAQWRAEGLIASAWPEAGRDAAPRAKGIAAGWASAPVDRFGLALALSLALLGVLVDRVRPAAPWDAGRGVWRRLRDRLRTAAG